MYVTACSKIGRTGVVPLAHFPRVVRSVFNGTVGPNQVKVKQNNHETFGFYYEGVRLRAKPLPFVHKGTIVVSVEFRGIRHHFHFGPSVYFHSLVIVFTAFLYIRCILIYIFGIGFWVLGHRIIYVCLYTIFFVSSFVLSAIFFSVHFDIPFFRLARSTCHRGAKNA